MRQIDTQGSIREICRLFGKSRQAYYQLEKRRIRSGVEGEIVLVYVREIRKQQPRIGTRKLFSLLKEIMKANDIEVNDLYALMAGRLEELQNTKNVHFNPKGNDVLSGQVAEVIEKALKERK